MKTLKAFAVISLSFVAVSGVSADEPKPTTPPSATQQSVLSQHQRVKADRFRHGRLVNRRQQIQTRIPSTQPSPPASTIAPANPPETNTKAADPVQIEQPRHSLFKRLLGGRSRPSSAISISQATASAPAPKSQSQPLPNAK